MTSTFKASAMIFCLSAAACTTSGHAERESARRPLEDDVLRALFSDASVAPVPLSRVNQSHPPGELFESRGTYVRVVGRRRSYGTFHIRSNMVCVQGEEFVQQCRQVVANEDGTYTLIDAADGALMRVTIEQHQ